MTSKYRALVRDAIAQGQAAEILVILRTTEATNPAGGNLQIVGRLEFFHMGKAGDFPMPDSDEPTPLFSPMKVGEPNEIDAFLQAMLDCAWARGLRPKP